MHHLDELEKRIRELETERSGKGKDGILSVNQLELHPWLARKDIVDWCAQRGVVAEAFCPITRGLRFNEPRVQRLTAKYSKTPAQILDSLELGYKVSFRFPRA